MLIGAHIRDWTEPAPGPSYWRLRRRLIAMYTTRRTRQSTLSIMLFTLLWLSEPYKANLSTCGGDSAWTQESWWMLKCFASSLAPYWTQLQNCRLNFRRTSHREAERWGKSMSSRAKSLVTIHNGL